MALIRPLGPAQDGTGVPKEITAPDTIDPAILPATSSSSPTRIPAGTEYIVPADSSVNVPSGIVIETGAGLSIAANARVKVD